MTNSSGMVFHALFRAHHNAIHAEMTARGVGDIGSPQILMVIRDLTKGSGRPPSQKELADRLHISPATVAASLKSLERNGYVERSVDPSDARRYQLSITRKAEAALKAGWEVFCSVDACMLSGFSPEEIEVLNAFHRRMLENLYRISGSTDLNCPHLGQEVPAPSADRTGPPKGSNTQIKGV